MATRTPAGGSSSGASKDARGNGGGQGGGQGYVVAPPVDNKAALCTTLRMNFNNCVAQQQAQPWRNINCNAWPLQLSASGCL